MIVGHCKTCGKQIKTNATNILAIDIDCLSLKVYAHTILKHKKAKYLGMAIGSLIMLIIKCGLYGLITSLKIITFPFHWIYKNL